MFDMTPDQWRDRLIVELDKRQPGIKLRRRYYDGSHRHPTGPTTSADEAIRLSVLSGANLCPNIVDAVVDRMRPTGIRGFGKTADDAQVWERMWHGNDVETTLPMVLEEAYKVGWAYTMTWPDADQPDGVSITGEDPTECIVGYDPATKRAVANMKRFRASDVTYQREYVILWFAGQVHYSQRALVAADSALWVPQSGSVGQWQPWGGPDDGEPVRVNTLGALPLDEFTSKPKLYGPIQPELSDIAINTTDRMNLRMYNSVVLGEHQAYPQRVALNIQIETDAAGNPINPLKPGPDRVWALRRDENAIGEPSITTLQAADMTQSINVLKFDVQLLATQTRTPMYELAGDLVNVGSDTVKALGVSHVKKVWRHIGNANDPIQGITRKWFLAQNESDRADRVGATIIKWEDPELRTLSERTDAATKLSAVGYPFAAVADRAMGESPTAIADLEAQRAAESVFGQLGAARAVDPDDLKKRVDAMGVLIRAGVKPDSAAAKVGLDDVEFIPGALPVTIKVDGVA